MERKRAYEEKEAKLREERKREERERWWAGVEIFKPRGNEGQGVSSKAATDEEIDKKAVLLNRYKLDYSRWNTWSPTDEATLAEAAEAQRLEEEARNKEFERNNAEFCNQFVTDMENRKKVTEKKQDSADISRLKGNRYFKAKAYDKALEFYMEALKESPFDAKTVNNIAQVYIKMKAYDDASEFLERTLYLEPINVKVRNTACKHCCCLSIAVDGSLTSLVWDSHGRPCPGRLSCWASRAGWARRWLRCRPH